MILLLLACAHAPKPDTADSGDGGDTDDTAAGACDLPPDPGRGMGFQAIVLRLSAQRCLVEEDIAALAAHVVDFQTVGPYCDAVMRTRSPDGLGDWSEPELVREHASVPEIFVTDAGAHVLAYNDLSPGLLEATVRDDPERLWRQGLIGIGGMGMSIDEGDGFVEVSTLDLHLDVLQQVVDPDFGQRADGTYRVSYFGITPEEMEDGAWDPLESALPHRFWRHTGAGLADFPGGRVAVESEWNEHGSADPTILDLADGSEILFVGGPDGNTPGWVSTDGAAWDVGAEPDLTTGFGTTTPDATPDPAGGYRLYFRDNVSGTYHLSTSADGWTWSESARIYTGPPGGGLSATVDPDGTWWLYFNLQDQECADRAD